MKLTPQQFSDKYGPEVAQSVRGTTLLASVKLAQMALETGWGKSINDAANNAYGIKADPSWTGKVISNTTSEVINGERLVFKGSGKIYINRKCAMNAGELEMTLFRAYDELSGSIRDHTLFLLSNKRYEHVFNATNYADQCHELKRCGYATGTDYDKILISIIEKYGFTKWDRNQLPQTTIEA